MTSDERKRKTTEEEDGLMVEARIFLLLVAVVSVFLGQDERVVSDD